MTGDSQANREMSVQQRATLSLCGDVMTGRGIDQVLPHPCPPHLYEPYASSALDYVALAERANGPIPHPFDDAYVWAWLSMYSPTSGPMHE